METEIFTSPEHWCLLVLVFSLIALQYIITPLFGREHNKLARSMMMAALALLTFVLLQWLCAQQQYWVAAAILVLYMWAASSYLQREMTYLYSL